ncbi:MAG: IS110 family transposase [Candidatus Omnitrophota bacterium]
MNYVGVDLHKERSWFYVTDETGNKRDSKSISNQPDELKKYFSSIPRPFSLAVEATYNCYFFMDIANMYTDKAYLANSYELKAFAKRHKKTDKIDARLIADVLRKGYLPIVTMPDEATRKIRAILRYRMNLVADRTRNITSLKAFLDKIGEDSTGNFATHKRLGELKYYHLAVEYQKVISGYIKRIDDLTSHIAETERFLKERASNDEDIVNLITMPGLDYFSAALIKSEIIDINRFSCFEKLCAYAGLAPRVSQSAHKSIHGPLCSNRRKHLQWILLEVVWHFIRKQPDKLSKYDAISKRKNANTAKVAIARDMLKVIYHILKEKRPFFRKEQIRSVAAPALVVQQDTLLGRGLKRP